VVDERLTDSIVRVRLSNPALRQIWSSTRWRAKLGFCASYFEQHRWAGGASSKFSWHGGRKQIEIVCAAQVFTPVTTRPITADGLATVFAAPASLSEGVDGTVSA
jgi:hypothetical protein